MAPVLSEEFLEIHLKRVRDMIRTYIQMQHTNNVLTTQLNHLASLAKWLSVRLRTRWLWVRVQLQSLKSCMFSTHHIQNNYTFAHSQQLKPNREPSVSGGKSLTTKLPTLNIYYAGLDWQNNFQNRMLYITATHFFHGSKSNNILKYNRQHIRRFRKFHFFRKSLAFT